MPVLAAAAFMAAPHATGLIPPALLITFTPENINRETKIYHAY